MSLLPPENAVGEKTAELIPERDSGLMSHVPHIWVVWINVEATGIVEDLELTWILEKTSIFLDISYNTLKAPCHSVGSGKKSSIHVNFIELFQADSPTSIQLSPPLSLNCTTVPICHQVLTVHKCCGSSWFRSEEW